MKKFLNVLFNIFWIIIVGLDSAICSAVMGTICMVTIVGIPFGIRHYKYIPLVFAPAGKKVVTKFSSHPVMNTFWLIFGGLVMFLVYAVIGTVLCITIVGIPLGRQLFKIAIYNLAPFGAEVIGEGEYSSYGDTEQDIYLLSRRVIKDPLKVVCKDAEGNPVTAKQYYAINYREYFNQVRDRKFKYRVLPTLLGVFVMFVCMGTAAIITSKIDITNSTNLAIALAVSGFVGGIAGGAVITNGQYRAYQKARAIFDFKMLEKAYPEDSPQLSEREYMKVAGMGVTIVDAVYNAVFTEQDLEQLAQLDLKAKLDGKATDTSIAVKQDYAAERMDALDDSKHDR